ncbi:hypothetical protein GCM10025857_36580 [Alicyclobacillus contaminans]|uniref:hypothetical protein n=1 Tax=Alicyclobacillus contaminans TaxID=392016 RepID=UPI00042A0A9E|nr:hypothetical protein [Alicyclobacillus contaminans]GMA52301.1 hypothetical protein GCM10025857_36580 [Alicyclobacillus contaminans]
MWTDNDTRALESPSRANPQPTSGSYDERLLDLWWDWYVWHCETADGLALPWWMRGAERLMPYGALRNAAESGVASAFTAAYPLLAPYHPTAGYGAYAMDPWAEQMYYSVWW